MSDRQFAEQQICATKLLVFIACLTCYTLNHRFTLLSDEA